jgi:two-component system OmpR family response regulator
MTFDAAVKHPPVLLIEDEMGLVEEISAELRGLGYPVSHADTIEGGLRAARVGGAAIMIADRLLQGSDGLAIIRTLREEGVKTPVLVISELSTVDERILVLKAGGDDYLAKPFAMAELVARVEVMARRLVDAPTTKLRVGSLEMDLIEQTVRRGAKPINLLPTEFKLLEYFLHRPGEIVTRAMLLEEVWHHRVGPQTNVIDVHIGKLRRKIDMRGRPSLIRNIRGAGFKLSADA